MRWARIARWLAVAAAAAAAAIVVNVVLLDAAQTDSDPVGKLNPRIFFVDTATSESPSTGSATTATEPRPDASTQPEPGGVTTGGAATTGSHGDDGGGSGSDADD